MNVFHFLGRACNDPEIKQTGGEKPMTIATFNVAINRDYRRQGDPESDFIRVTAFGKVAEGIDKYVKKGVKIIGTCHVQNENWEKDGVKHYGFKFILDRWEFAESKKAAAEYAETEQEPAKSKGDDFVPIPTNLDIDMPFA